MGGREEKGEGGREGLALLELSAGERKQSLAS